MKRKIKFIEAEPDNCNLSGEEGMVPGPTLMEATGPEGWVWEVMLIRSGLSANGNLYPPEVLKKAAPLFEGVRALARSDEEHLQDKGKDVKNIVGWFDNVRFSEGNLIATFTISKAADWLRVLLKDAWEQGKKDIVGLSIVAEGTGQEAPDGKITVQSIDKVNSVDVIVNPAAGGGFLKLVAALQGSSGDIDTKNTQLAKSAGNSQLIGSGSDPQEGSMKKKLLEALKAKALEKFNTIDPEKITQEKLVKILAEACPDDAEVKALLAEVEAKPAPPAEPKNLPTPDPAPGPATNGSGDTPVPLTESVNDQANAELESIKKIRCGLELTNILAGAELPAPVASLVEARFKDRVYESAELIEAINLQKEMLAKLTESGKITGLGFVRTEMGDGEKEKTIKALDGFFANKDIDKIPRFMFFKEAYIHITGDKYMSGQLDQCPNLHKFVEALSSSSWAEILGDSLRRRMVAEYETPGMDDWRKIVSDISNLSDFRTNRRMRMGGYGILPAVAEKGPYDPLSSPGDEEATFAITKYGGTETVTMEMIANDDQGAIRRIPQKLGRGAAITLYRFVFDFIKDNNNVTYEAVALFHADHSNLGAAALSATSLLAAKIAMADQTAYGEDTNILGLMPKHLLVPSELQDLAYRLTTAAKSVGSAEGTPRYTDIEPNIHSTYGLEVVLVPYWTDATDWVLVCNVGDCPTIEVGFYQGRQEPELFIQDQPTVGSLFNTDEITYKIRHIYGAVVLDHRGMYKAVV